MKIIKAIGEALFVSPARRARAQAREACAAADATIECHDRASGIVPPEGWDATKRLHERIQDDARKRGEIVDVVMPLAAEGEEAPPAEVPSDETTEP